MLIVTNDNFNEVFEAAVNAYKNSIYNYNCFSSNDVRMEIAASNELDRLCNKLEELNVDFKTYIAPIFKKYDIAINENYSSNINTKEFPKSLKLEINCNTLELLFNEKDRHLIVEGYEPTIKEEFFVQFQDGARFAYQQWDITDEAINELRKVNKFDNIFKVTNAFTINKKLISIGVIRDLFSGDGIDCSSILLKYEDREGETFICGAMGGFYEDVAIINNDKLVEVLPIYPKKQGSFYRTLNKKIEVKVDSNTGCDYVSESVVMDYTTVQKFINHILKYENILLNLAE